MTFGIFDLLSGIPFIPCIIGLFGLSQVIQTMVNGIHKRPDLNIDKITYKNSFPSKDEWKRTIGPTLRGSFLGFFIGLLPGSGATTATFLSYTTEKRINKNGHLMGTGVPEGIAASEAADNAASIGSFAPLLSLGIPGSGTSAVLLGGLMMWGLQPGPLFMSENPEFSWTLIASMFVGDFILIIICIAAIPILANILKVPNTILVPVILCVSMLGAYSVNNSMFDIYIMIIAGAIGYLLVRFEIPLAPIALSLILGPSLETAIRQSFSISSGNPAVFFTRPLSLGIFIVGAFLIIMPIIVNSIKKKKPADITKVA
jgi:putative tricarboxylic transport membrane protein